MRQSLPADLPRLQPLGAMANIQPLWARHDPVVPDDWLALGGTVLMAGASELDSLPPPDLVIDALLGTGVHTPLSPLLTKIVATINSLGAPVLAVDLPGHGRSGGMPLPSIEALADWIKN